MTSSQPNIQSIPKDVGPMTNVKDVVVAIDTEVAGGSIVVTLPEAEWPKTELIKGEFHATDHHAGDPLSEEVPVKKPRKNPTPKKVTCSKCNRERFSQAMKAIIEDGNYPCTNFEGKVPRYYICRKQTPEGDCVK